MTEEWKWLESTYKLQRETYEYPLDILARGAIPGASAQLVGPLAAYIFWNLFAAQQELAEAAVEFSWKPWAVDFPFVNRERMLDEIVDANHFLGNILVGMGVTDEEYERAYRQKQDKNRARQASGTYSAKKGGLGEGSDV